MSEKHLIVVSADALVFEDLEYAATLPNFRRILEDGSVIERVKTIYPSLTHPVHATMLTGVSAGKTGVINNVHFAPFEKGERWFNYLSEINTPTILHEAKKHGLTTAVCRWPMTADGGAIVDYLIPEVLRQDMEGHENNPIAVYKKLGTSECLTDIVEDALKIYTETNEHPAYDEFEIFCAAEIIRRHKPNLLFTHPGFIDGERHKSGLFTDRVKEAIKVTDRWLGMLWEAVCDAGLEDKTDIIVLGDHGQLNITRRVNLNVFFKDAGLISADENGNLKEWQAYAISAGLSAQVYLSDPENEELYSSVHEMLKRMAEENLYGFEKVFTKDEVKRLYGLDGDFSFVLESDGFTAFAEGINRPVVKPIDLSDYRFGNATHGHMPEKGPQPTFICAGPSIKKGVKVERGEIINHAPTFAAILGFSLPYADGKPVKEILK